MRYELADAHLAHALHDLLDVVLAVDVAQPCIDEARAVPAAGLNISPRTAR